MEHSMEEHKRKVDEVVAEQELVVHELLEIN